MRTQRPSTGWYWLAGFIALAGLAAAIAWGMASYLQISDRAMAFPRTTIPGATAVVVTEPSDLTVYYEAPRIAGDETVPALDIRVTDPAGRPITPTPYDVNQRLDIPGHVAIAVSTFSAPRGGEYTVTVRGAAPAAAAVSVGPALGLAAAADIVGAVMVATLTSLLALAMVVVVAVRRTRQPAPQPMPAPRQPVGVP